MSGWIKLHRALIDWEWYTDHNTCRLFIHCLLRANHDSKKWRGYTINRGEFISSFERLGDECGLSRQQVRTSINKLKSTRDITNKSRAQHTVFIVNNYDSYQSDNQQPNIPITTEQPSSNQAVTTNKNVRSKECKNNPKSENKFSDKDFELSQWIYSLILSTAPKTKEPNHDKWADIIRLMRERDNLTHREIAEVFKWANNDPFWKTNILSPDTLRKQFSSLHAKMGNNHETNQRSNQPRKPSAVDRARIAAEERKRIREASVRGNDGYALAGANQDLRPSTSEPIRGDDTRHLGAVVEGNFTQSD